MRFNHTAFRLIALAIGALLAAGILSPSPASAQVRESPRPFVGAEELQREMKRRPQMHTIRLTGIPDSWVTVTGPRAWLQTTPPSASSGSIPGAYALRMVRQIRYASYCGVLRTDTVDLRKLRANGYRLVRYRVLPHQAPGPYIDKPTYRTRPPVKPAEAEFISVSWRFGISQLTQSCWSGYSLDIEVNGPKDTDPITGGKKTWPQVN